MMGNWRVLVAVSVGRSSRHASSPAGLQLLCKLGFCLASRHSDPSTSNAQTVRKNDITEDLKTTETKARPHVTRRPSTTDPATLRYSPHNPATPTSPRLSLTTPYHSLPPVPPSYLPPPPCRSRLLNRPESFVRHRLSAGSSTASLLPPLSDHHRPPSSSSLRSRRIDNPPAIGRAPKLPSRAPAAPCRRCGYQPDPGILLR